ncbi:MAG: serine protease [Bacillaceae bacterium]|nr:serine protease [Bacillaceae bacterium]
MDVIKFLRTSYRLSQLEEVQFYKEAVVTIQGDRSRGTGFTVSEDGLIITNHHVIENQNQITVVFQKGERMKATVVQANPDYDIALLQVDATGLPYLELNEATGIIKEPIIVIGNPLSFTQIANEGYVLENGEQLLISAPIYRGNSGSPVINTKGEVVGVVYAKRKASEYGGKSVGIATPIEKVLEVLNE